MAGFRRGGSRHGKTSFHILKRITDALHGGPILDPLSPEVQQRILDEAIKQLPTGNSIVIDDLSKPGGK